MRNAILMMLLAVVSGSAAAGQSSYSCAIENVYLLDENGAIEKNAKLTIALRGERFSVDRQTGGIIGERVPAFRPDKFVVLFPGGNGNSFKSYFQGYNFVGYLEVYEYHTGRQKGFVLHDGISMLTGFCE